MKTVEGTSKTPTATSTKSKAGARLSCGKSAISATKAAKQRKKSTGNTLIYLESDQSGQAKTINRTSKRSLDELPAESFLSEGENNKEFSGLSLSPTIASLVPRQSSHCFQKFKLQLFPMDEVTRKGLEMDKHNPYLELTLGPRKKVSSVVKHLNAKWGNSKTASGDLKLFPYNARVENLASHRSWSLKDSATSVADVLAAVGNPSIFRLRYGWLSNLKPRICGMPLISFHSEDNLQTKEEQKKSIVEEETSTCPVVSLENGLLPAGDQDVGTPISLDKSVQAVDNQKSGNSSSLLWADVSNISFGALLSEASANVGPMPLQRNASLHQIPTTCDSFDAAISRFKAMNQSTPVLQSSIWDAEETCNAFSFQKIASSCRSIPSQSHDIPITSFTQKISSSPLRLNDKLGDACEEPISSLDLHTKSDACPQPTIDSQSQRHNDVSEEPKAELHTEASHNDSNQFGKLDIYWPESLGPLEYALPSSRQVLGGDSIGLGSSIASSLDAFQNFSIF